MPARQQTSPAQRAGAAEVPPIAATDDARRGASDAVFAAVQAFVAELARSGVAHVCIAPGARSTPLALAIAAQPGLRAWSHVDERGAAFFALGIAKATRRPAAVVCTSGSAAANFLPAVVEARHAHVPLLLLTADRPAELRGCGAPQAIDQLKLYGDQAKWFCEVGDTGAGLSYFRAVACRAAATAAATPAGPVHLNFPFREPLLPDAFPAPAPSPRSVARTTLLGTTRAPDPAAIEALATRLAGSARGVVVCGPCDHEPATAVALTRLAARLGYPILADATSQLRAAADDGDVVIDAYDLVLRDPAFAARARPAVVVRIGPLPTSKVLTAWLRTAPHIVVDPHADWNDPLQAADTMLHCDVAPLCAALAARLAPAPDRDWLRGWQSAARRARAALDTRLQALDEPFEGSVFDALARRLPDGATLYVGNSMAMRDLEGFWPRAARRVRVLCNRGTNGIDGFVSSALGAAAASGAPLVAVTGDLGFLHDLNGLLAAARHGLRATFVVLNNDGGGIFAYLPQAECGEAFRELFLTPHGLDLRGGVEMYGCAFTRARDRSAFAAALDEALGAPRTSVIEVPIDLRRSVALHRELWAAAAGAVGGVPR